MAPTGTLNILLVDDQPGKLLSYQAILEELGENLLKANSAQEALALLLKTEVALILVDVCMPELDGFQLVGMIREHPRFQRTPIIFISAIQVTDLDSLRGYEMGAVDYVPVPVVPEVLRAKVRVFLELHRKTRDLERLNAELEQRVLERTSALESSNRQLLQSEARRSLALVSGRMGAWEYDLGTRQFKGDDGVRHILQVDVAAVTPAGVRTYIHPDDWPRLLRAVSRAKRGARIAQIEFRVLRPDGEVRWCSVSSATGADEQDRPQLISGVVVDLTNQKEAEQRLILLAGEVDHRARNAIAVVQSVLRMTNAASVPELKRVVDGRVQALARAHTLLSQSRWEGANLLKLIQDELAPYADEHRERVQITGPGIQVRPKMAQTFALAIHELATNAAKYGALSVPAGRLAVEWAQRGDRLTLYWTETNGPPVSVPHNKGFGTRVITTSVEGDLGGRASFDWRAEGLSCAISVPWAGLAPLPDEAAAPPPPAAVSAAAVDNAPQHDAKVLLVEDEALVGMMIMDMISRTGLSVVGPVSTLDEAVQRAREEDIDVAILDINIDGKPNYAAADVLIERGIPFVFSTGYEASVIDPRYANVAVLQKPVDEQMLKAALTACMRRAPSAPGRKQQAR